MGEWWISCIILRRTVCSRLKKTYSSHCKSRVSLTLSLKQPSEYMLSNTSGSSSVRDKIRLTHTLLGGGCSGHGSLRPPLGHTHARNHKSDKHLNYHQCYWAHQWIPHVKRKTFTYWYQACFWMASSCKRRSGCIKSLVATILCI